MPVVLDYTVRPMKRSEIPQAVEIWTETRLDDGTKCIETWYEIDPDGFYVAVTGEGEVIGVCSAVFNKEDLAFVGTYAVKEEYRGQGIGPKIWKACYEHIGDHNAGVNAVPGKKELYRDRGGFPVEETEWLSVCCETDEVVDPKVLTDRVKGVDVARVDDSNLPMVLDYDEALIGYRRSKAITLTVREQDSVSFLATKNGRCAGYGTIKMSVLGRGLVGPLYADDQEVAEVLLRRLIENLPKARGLVLMIIDKNKGARSIVTKTGLEWHEECPRCYKKYKYDVDISKIYGQLNLNFSPY